MLSKSDYLNNVGLVSVCIKFQLSGWYISCLKVCAAGGVGGMVKAPSDYCVQQRWKKCGNLAT